LGFWLIGCEFHPSPGFVFATGSRVGIQEPDGTWRLNDLALMVFEDGSGGSSSGTAETSTINLAVVVAEAGMTVNAAESSRGCMSFPGDADSTTVIAKLALAHDSFPAGAEPVLRCPSVGG
jgi:hypothetical protein